MQSCLHEGGKLGLRDVPVLVLVGVTQHLLQLRRQLHVALLPARVRESTAVSPASNLFDTITVVKIDQNVPDVIEILPKMTLFAKSHRVLTRFDKF